MALAHYRLWIGLIYYKVVLPDNVISNSEINYSIVRIFNTMSGTNGLVKYLRELGITG